MRSFFAVAFLAATLAAGAAATPQVARGQELFEYTLGAGAQLGVPLGLSVKFYDRPGVAYDVLAAFNDSDDIFYVNAHRVHEQPLPFEAPAPLRFFHGPGALAGVEASEGPALGISYTAGLSLPFDRLEASLQFTPRLRVFPDTDLLPGGGLSLRYYFSARD